MSRRTPPVYHRGKYWLGWDERANGTRRSPFLTIFWYDPDARRERSASTGTADEGAAIIALDRRYLADADEAPAFCGACGQPLAQAQAYLLTDAIADYKLEWGNTRASADTIESRLNHVVDFLDAEEALGEEGRFRHRDELRGRLHDGVRQCAARLVPAAAGRLAERQGRGDGQPSAFASGDRSIDRAAHRRVEPCGERGAAEVGQAPDLQAAAADQVQRKRRTRVGVEELA